MVGAFAAKSDRIISRQTASWFFWCKLHGLKPAWHPMLTAWLLKLRPNVFQHSDQTVPSGLAEGALEACLVGMYPQVASREVAVKKVQA